MDWDKADDFSSAHPYEEPAFEVQNGEILNMGGVISVGLWDFVVGKGNEYEISTDNLSDTSRNKWERLVVVLNPKSSLLTGKSLVWSAQYALLVRNSEPHRILAKAINFIYQKK